MNNSFIRRRRGLVDRFTILGNDVLCDERLSWRGLGVLCFLLHLPADFQLHLQHISSLRQRRGARAAATGSAFSELCAAGYMQKECLRNARGQIIGTVWHVADQPLFRASSAFEPDPGNPETVSPDPDFRGLQSKKFTKKKCKQTTTTAAGGGVVVDFSLEELLAATAAEQKSAGKTMGAGLVDKITERFTSGRCNERDRSAVDKLRRSQAAAIRLENRKSAPPAAELPPAAADEIFKKFGRKK